MSIVLTSNIHLHASQLPFGALPLTQLVVPHVVLTEGGLTPVLIDGQNLNYDSWVSQIKSCHPKIVVLAVDDAFLLSIKRLKEDLGSVSVVVCTQETDLTETLIFDYDIDFICFDTDYLCLPDLIRTMNHAFAPFYDHISGIAYKNGAGELTKTDIQSMSQSRTWEVPKELLKGYDVVLMPKGLVLLTDSQIKVIGENELVLQDLSSYQSSVQYDRFLLRIPSSKKALKTLKRILEDQKPKLNTLHIYPSCDLEEDLVYYARMGEAIHIYFQMKHSSWIKRMLLSRKLKNLLNF